MRICKTCNIFDRIICVTFASYALLGYSIDTLAWGPDGHTAVGVLAISQLQPGVQRELESMVGPLDGQALAKACNWPDAIREIEEWAWSAPQHYVNIPRGNFVYQQSRDCPEQLCATEAIKHYAAGLVNDQASKQQRWQSFAWLCHLVGDLHQPLHAGYADDRGGNNFDVVFKGEQMNLHTFWDFVLIDQHAGSWQNFVELLNTSATVQSDFNWSPQMVNEWTNESHELVKRMVYPATRNIAETYVQQSWGHVRKQISSAASRLSLILNSELQDRD